MIRLFNVYYPVRALLLLAVETMVVFSSFLLGMMLAFPDDRYIVLNYEFSCLLVNLATIEGRVHRREERMHRNLMHTFPMVGDNRRTVNGCSNAHTSRGRKTIL